MVVFHVGLIRTLTLLHKGWRIRLSWCLKVCELFGILICLEIIVEVSCSIPLLGLWMFFFLSNNPHAVIKDLVRVQKLSSTAYFYSINWSFSSLKHGTCTVPNHQYDTPFSERKQPSVHVWRESVCVCVLYMCECLSDSTVPSLSTSPIQSVP